MNELFNIKLKSPVTAEWLNNWQSKFNKTFDFSKASEQKEFVEALEDMGKYISHTSYKATLSTILDKSGVSTVYINVGLKKD